MSQQAILSTTEAIAAVYDLLGRPGEDALPASIATANYWFQLDKICLRIGISDRTFFMDHIEFNGAKNTSEINLGEIANFGNELSLEITELVGGIERKTPVDLIEDVRDIPTAQHLCANLFRYPDQPKVPVLLFNQPLPGTYRFRLRYEPGSFNRPDQDEVPVIPGEAQSLLIALTARTGLPAVLQAFGKEMYLARKEIIDAEVEQFSALFENLITKDISGTPHRTAANESRRQQGRYGARNHPLLTYDRPIISGE